MSQALPTRSFEGRLDLELGNFDAWSDRDRIVVDVASLYRESSGGALQPNVIELFGEMERWLGRRQRRER